MGTASDGPVPDEEFLGMVRTGDATWTLPVTTRLVSPAGTLYGGAGLAAAICALEAVVGLPLRWITTQFVGTAPPGSDVTVSVEVLAGRRTVQARATAMLGDRHVLDALAALGEGRAEVPAGTWVEPPEVPAPDECESLARRMGPMGSSFFDLTERRLAGGRSPMTPFQAGGAEPSADGRLAFWSRVTGQDSTTAAMLGWLADVVPMGVSAGLGVPMGATSLDNTLRVIRSAPAEWILVDIRPEAAEDGFAHGSVHLWTPDGTLLATGGQTALLRSHPPIPG